MNAPQFQPGELVDITIRGARISERHVQDKNLWFVLPDGSYHYLPARPVGGVTVTRVAEQVEPMDRLNDAMTRAVEALRDALHAIHDVDPSTALPGDWYDRIGQLHAITQRTGDLLAMTASRVRDLPVNRLYATDGSDVTSRVAGAGSRVHEAAGLVSRSNSLVNRAWSAMSVVAVSTGDGPR